MAMTFATEEDLVRLYRATGVLTQDGEFRVDELDGQWRMPDGEIRRIRLKHYTLDPPWVDT